MKIRIHQMAENDYRVAESLLDFTEAEVEFLTAFKKRDASLFSIYCDELLVGISQIEQGKRGFIYLFIDKKYRHKGIGREALALSEQQVKVDGLFEIVTKYDTVDSESRSFAELNGYVRKFESMYMCYTGEPFELSNVSIRPYCDDDYDAAHSLYALAFHEMRISTGDFPDSVVEAPSPSMRAQWAKTAHERWVYTEGNEIIGYARIEDKEIASVSIKSQNQGQGVGRKFVSFLCNEILSKGYNSVDLFCVVGNKAKRLYDRIGFEDIYVVEYAVKPI